MNLNPNLKMSLNLRILPLTTIENFVIQKCLLPKEHFPVTAPPGQWSKCYFHETTNYKQNYAVCQIFPREDGESVCYLDTCVSSGLYINEENQWILDKIEILKNHLLELKKVDVVFHINPEFCINNINSLTKSNLNDLAQILLQKYQLTKSCFIKDSEMQECSGIDSISIDIKDDSEGGNIFLITDDTFINITNILLTPKLKPMDLIPLNVPCFHKARQDLNDLIEIVKLQRSSSKSFRVGLNILLVGPVGCGKTTLVEEFLRQYRCNVFRINTGNVMKQYPGETEAELRKIFKAACHFEKNIKSKGN